MAKRNVSHLLIANIIDTVLKNSEMVMAKEKPPKGQMPCHFMTIQENKYFIVRKELTTLIENWAKLD